jgi:ferredoxin/rubrerythrin
VNAFQERSIPLANVTFSSPVMAKDLTVYAIAGHRGTILAIARANKVPIPFDCQDGECGSCLVKVDHLAKNVKCAVSLTEKEKEMLRQLGKITQEEIREAEVNDVAPPYRLACQCFVRDEDILVSFEGDQTLPVQRPHLSYAAKVYKGGMEIKSLDEFLGFAVRLEEDSSIHYDELGAAMEEVGNEEVAKLFRDMAHYSRLHLAQARERAGSIDVEAHFPPDYVWPDSATPERNALWAGDADLSRLDALKTALQGERRGYEFYYSVWGTTKDPEIAAMANEFVKEEAEHVEILERWIAREAYVVKTAKEAAAATQG